VAAAVVARGSTEPGRRNSPRSSEMHVRVAAATCQLAGALSGAALAARISRRCCFINKIRRARAPHTGRALLGFNPPPTIVEHMKRAREGQRRKRNRPGSSSQEEEEEDERMDGKGDGAKPTITVTTLIQ